MDPISDWVASSKIPVGRWGASFFDFLTINFAWFFDNLADGLTWVLNSMVSGLLWLPPIVLIALIAALAYALKRSVLLSVGVALGLLFIVNQGLWQATVETRPPPRWRWAYRSASGRRTIRASTGSCSRSST
jgi:glycine betaine/proline transport system permease protein